MEANDSHDHLLDAFRAHLHTVITAKQFGQSARLPNLPGPSTVDYCAKLPVNALAGELAGPILAILKQIDEAAMHFHRCLHHKQIKDSTEQAKCKAILEQLDFALALILRNSHGIRFRAKCTKCSDLLVETICRMLEGDEVACLIRRYQKELDDDPREEDGSVVSESFPDMFAWDTYRRVQQLDKLADEFPEHVKTAARRMHGWPMLIHRHTNNQKRFKELAKRLELGIHYPLDAGDGARFRPDTPLIRYLVPLFEKLDYVRYGMIVGEEYRKEESREESQEDEANALKTWWRDAYNFNDEASPELIEASRVLHRLPDLTKTTAIEWAEKAIVPVIMVTDAADWKNCQEPALKTIAKQRGVKSRATFKSRLLAAVSATLRRLARPE